MRARWITHISLLSICLTLPACYERATERAATKASEVAHGPDYAKAQEAYRSGDFKAAFRVFENYAQRGDAKAQFLVGRMYDFGQGVPRSDREALNWFRRAAAGKNAEAQYELGRLYESGTIGESVLEDYETAAFWYRRAAAQGNIDAMQALGTLYSDGGLPPNYVRAHMWLNLAVAAVRDADERYLLIGFREKLAERLDSAQVLEAQRLARECLASNYQRCGEPN